MSTRCLIKFANADDKVESTIYQHYDGYPEGVLPELNKFYAAVESETNDHRYNDAPYLAAKFVVWLARQNAQIESKADDWRKPNQGNLNFLGVGVLDSTAGNYGAAYIYTLKCANGARPTITYFQVGDGLAGYTSN